MMGRTKPVRVLIPLHPGVDLLDFAGPIELLSHARRHAVNGGCSFDTVIASSTGTIVTEQGIRIVRDISMDDAYAELSSFDILIVPGGASARVLETQSEPLHLIKMFAHLPAHNTGSTERMLVSVCTGSLFLASAGLLKGQTCTTNSADLSRLNDLLQGQNARVVGDQGERFVVNPLGSVDGHEDLRVATSAGPVAGMDLTLWMIEYFAGKQQSVHIERLVEYKSRVDEGLVL